jgi:hypothetical protein
VHEESGQSEAADGGMKHCATPSTVTTRLDRVSQYSRAFQSIIDALECRLVRSSRTMTTREKQDFVVETIANYPNILLRL